MINGIYLAFTPWIISSAHPLTCAGHSVSVLMTCIHHLLSYHPTTLLPYTAWLVECVKLTTPHEQSCSRSSLGVLNPNHTAGGRRQQQGFFTMKQKAPIVVLCIGTSVPCCMRLHYNPCS